MSKESVRDKIDNVIADYAEEVADGNYTLSPAEDTDRILGIIRTALLSEPAVDAAMAVVEYRSQEPFAAQDWKEERDDWKEAFSAAWDSVMEAEEGE